MTKTEKILLAVAAVFFVAALVFVPSGGTAERVTPAYERPAPTAAPVPEDGALMRAVLELPEKYRAPIHLFYFEDYSIEEISALLGRRPGTVKSQLSRARALLKTALKEAWNDDES